MKTQKKPSKGFESYLPLINVLPKYEIKEVYKSLKKMYELGTYFVDDDVKDSQASHHLLMITNAIEEIITSN